LHGYGVAQHLLRTTSDALRVGESALYPALQRLLVNGWAKAEWRISETGRRARYYTLTSKGRQRLEEEEREFEQMVRTVRLVLEGV
jgi:DNA-binding PadR family transcriptional regulator